MVSYIYDWFFWREVYNKLGHLACAGIHNIVCYFVLILCVIRAIKSFKEKKYYKNIILAPLILFCIYSTFTVSGSARLFLAQMGHPVEAYTTPSESINIRKKSWNYYIVDINTGKNDIEGFYLVKNIQVKRILFICFSYFVGFV